MFNKLFELEKELNEMQMFLKCGIYRINKGNLIIFVREKIQMLNREIEHEKARIKALYF